MDITEAFKRIALTYTPTQQEQFITVVTANALAQKKQLKSGKRRAKRV